eukprot:3224952-Rhodomonas_salina.1
MQSRCDQSNQDSYGSRADADPRNASARTRKLLPKAMSSEEHATMQRPGRGEQLRTNGTTGKKWETTTSDGDSFFHIISKTPGHKRSGTSTAELREQCAQQFIRAWGDANIEQQAIISATMAPKSAQQYVEAIRTDMRADASVVMMMSAELDGTISIWTPGNEEPSPYLHPAASQTGMVAEMMWVNARARGLLDHFQSV